jgi:hypothetical protein
MLTKKDHIKNDVKNNKNSKNSSSSHTHDSHSHDNHNGCCQPLAKIPSQQPAKIYSQQEPNKQTNDAQQANKREFSKTRITVKYDAGYPNQLYIRGKGANLNWDKGLPLKNTKPDEWVWETDAQFTHCEFKILINDHIYENGDNHLLNAGSTLLYTPHFH